jgi:phosphoribosylaminoimidazole-succinocarboxamide synthase
MESQTITTTDFAFPGQQSLYHGKVRDIYTISDKYLVAIATDRISAFDVILPRPIPFKGQVLNQLAAHFLQKTSDILPNWLINIPDPNVTIGFRYEPFKIEMVVRGGLVGHAWRAYKDGERTLCGIPLPDGMQEYDMFPEPIITPSTKAEAGHDEDISANEIIRRNRATQAEFAKLSDYALKLFARGQDEANKRGLLLMDTKYEFGKDTAGTIYVIDEIHTPDSSRYFYTDSYAAYIKDRNQALPRHLSKEFVREWLMERGFSGQTGQTMPDMTDEFVTSVSERYIELYEQLSGLQFEPPDASSNPLTRIESHCRDVLEQL